jgi:hypothetical protein
LLDPANGARRRCRLRRFGILTGAKRDRSFVMRPISILGFAAATACAALVASAPAEAAYRRIAGPGYAPAARHVAYARPYARAAYVGGYRRAWGGRGYGLAAGAAIGAAAGYAAANAYDGGYGYAAPASYGYAQPASYGYSAPASQTWSRTYAIPQTVVEPVVRTHYEPVTTYRAVQSTSYVPRTVYRHVTKTCTCTIDGVTQQVPCAGGYGAGYGAASYSGAAVYGRPGVFTSPMW